MFGLGVFVCLFVCLFFVLVFFLGGGLLVFFFLGGGGFASLHQLLERLLARLKENYYFACRPKQRLGPHTKPNVDRSPAGGDKRDADVNLQSTRCFLYLYS